MSSAAAADAAPPAKGKKKLVLIAAVAALVVAGGGGAALMLKKKPAEEGDEAAEASEPAAKHAKAHDPKAVPTFVPLDPFTVNLADRDAERYAQVGITLELADPKGGDAIKAFMPAIRHNILLALADRTAAELMGRDGKKKLAERIRRETSRALGVEVEDEEHADADAEADSGKKPAKKKKKKAEPVLPVTAVHFSNFIIQ